MSGARNKQRKGSAKGRVAAKATPAKAASGGPAKADEDEDEDEDDDDDDDEDEDDEDDEGEGEGEGEGKRHAAAPKPPKSGAGPRSLREAIERRDWRGAVEALTEQRAFRIALAVSLVCIHLLMFQQAGWRRLGMPFNSAPGADLVFNDLHAPATRGQPRQPTHWSRLVVARWDAQHYEGTAVRGLQACPTDPSTATGGDYLDCGLGWLPGYGWVGGIVSSLTGFQADYSLVLLSALCAMILNCLWISKTMIKRLGKFQAYGVLIAFNFYPEAWNVVTPLVEAAVLALAVGGFIALCKERWVWSAVLIGASTALRMPTAAFAIGLGCALLWATWKKRQAGDKRWWRPLYGVPFCGWGQFLTMLVLQVKLGNWLAFFSARKAFGDHNRMDRLTDVAWWLHGFTAETYDMVVLVGMLAITALTWRRVVAKFSSTENMFLVVSSLVTILLVLLAPFNWAGMGRYMMLCLLPFLGMGVMAKHHRTLFVMWFLLCAVLYWHITLCNYISQGDPQVCPASGRTELHMPFAS